MRLPSYFQLNNAPSGRDLPLRLVESVFVVVCAITVHKQTEGSSFAAYRSTVVALAIIFAWCAMDVRGTSRAAPRVGALLSALGWVFCEALAIGTVKLMHPDYQPSLGAFAGLGVMTALGIFVLRIAGSRGAPIYSVAVAGCRDHCAFLVRSLDAIRKPIYRIEAQFETGAPTAPPLNGVPRFFDLDAFTSHVRTRRIDELWLALPLTDEKSLRRVLHAFRNELVNIRFIPDVTSLSRFQSSTADGNGLLAINLVASPLNGDTPAIKTIFDRVFATCAILGTLPLLIAIALAVKLSSPGPVLFKQRRRGASGQPFEIYKFRTMHLHAADDGVVQATRGDPRVTRVGAFLRRTSLDELPQFFNVLRGEMSVVGPRPHAIENDDLYQDIVDDYIHRYRIKPGITGWAQINGFRGETDSVDKMQQRIEHDLYYLGNWSFALDMRIVLATIVRGFVHRNAY
ncbi:undecaprenyl-phosphate glucose phosphotransferase [Caballeronia sp. ATUFL_F1_KS4A]|uniref:undecaprenyl-phosphate glucose phosphotransferase n=1 Tax=Caballeronia sp. ATUFL_F1_KS4A TaxID=2921768 RepID=UPI0020291B4E|nr:undecaprenyl-phosphate glucose phosphotransferase [Caballeronia sp. ATUFL_F1_KS4A]